MHGKGTFVRQAQPNLLYKFIPTPSYWVAAGEEVTVGTVLDIQTITKTAEVKFPYGVFKMKATLNERNNWVIKQLRDEDTVTAAVSGTGGSTSTTTTTNTRTTTTYCCALV